MAVELVPLCRVEATLAEPIMVGDGPGGLRLIYEVLEATITGDRVTGKMKGRASADWLTICGTVATLDVRATLETDDGAVILAQYRGRSDLSQGPGASPVYVAPLFETADPRYAWLNAVQAVGKGSLDGNRLIYEWFEVR